MAEGKIDSLKPGDFPGVSRPPSSETLFMFMNLANPDRVNWNSPRPLDRVVKLNAQKPGQEELHDEQEEEEDDDHDNDARDHGRDSGSDEDEDEQAGVKGRPLPRNQKQATKQSSAQVTHSASRHGEKDRVPAPHNSKHGDSAETPGVDDTNAYHAEEDADFDNDDGDDENGGGGDDDDFMSSISGALNRQTDVHHRQYDQGAGRIAGQGDKRGIGDGPEPMGDFDWHAFAANNRKIEDRDHHGIPLGSAVAFSKPQDQDDGGLRSNNTRSAQKPIDRVEEDQDFAQLFAHGRSGAQERRLAAGERNSAASAAVSTHDVFRLTSGDKRLAGTPKRRPSSRSSQRSSSGGIKTNAFDQLVQESMTTGMEHGASHNSMHTATAPGEYRRESVDEGYEEAELRRIAERTRPGLFNAAVASHVNSLRDRRQQSHEGTSRRDNVRVRARDDDASTIVSVARYMHPDKEKTRKASSKPNFHGDSDSDTDAYEEKAARLDALDPNRPPDSDEEEEFYSMSEDQFRRWRARRDSRKMHEIQRNRRRRRKEREMAEKRAKSAYIAQLGKLKLQGIPISKEYTMDDDLEDMRLEFERHQACTAMMQKVETMRRTIGAVLCIAELILCALRVHVEGWSAEVVKELDNKKYDAVLEKLYRKYWKKSAPSPEFSLALMVLGMLAMKWLQNREARARGLDAASGRSTAAEGAGSSRPGIGGALSSVAQGVLGSLMGRGPSLFSSLLGGLTGSNRNASPTIPTTSSPVPPPTPYPPVAPTPANFPRAPTANIAPSAPATGNVDIPISVPAGAWSFARARRATPNNDPQPASTSPAPTQQQPVARTPPLVNTRPQSPLDVSTDPRAMAARAAEMRRRQSLNHIRSQQVELMDDQSAESASRRVRQISGDV